MLCAKQRMEEICRKLNFEGCLSIDVVGRSGGLCVFWRFSAQVTLINLFKEFCEFGSDGGGWRGV
ncbi:hypothetical protein LINPERHAP1_LOCUS14883 [Linum perenne]